MSRLDASQNILHARIVYWGPAGAGKSASLSALRRFVDPEDRLRLYRIGSRNGRTRFFDMLALEDFKYGTVRVRGRALAVPGDKARSPARTAILEDADVLVFVANSSRAAEDANLESLRELTSALRARGRDPGTLPIVWALNKRDEADALTVGDMRALLGCGDRPVHETIASMGNGVFECFDDAMRAMLALAAERHGFEPPADCESPAMLLPQLARGSRPKFARPRSSEPRELSVEVEREDVSQAAQSIETQVRLAEAHAEVEAVNRMLEARNKELMAVNRVARSILSAMEPDNLLVVLLDATTEHIGVTHASCVVFDPAGDGQLRSHVHGFGRDPVLGLARQEAGRFFKLMEDSDGPVPASEKHNAPLLRALSRVDRRVNNALFQSIRGKSGSPAGWISIYFTEPGPSLTTQQLLFLSSISRLAALGLDKIGLLDQMQRRNAAVEKLLSEQTSKLEMANARVRALNRGMESRVTERTKSLEESNRVLRESRAGTIHLARLEGLAGLASSLASQIGDPLYGLNEGLDKLRSGLDKVRVALASAPDGAEGLSTLDDLEQVLGDVSLDRKKLSGLVGSLERFGETTHERATVSLNAVVADALTLLDARISRCAKLDLRLGDVGDVEGDLLALRHVVRALLTNAVEALEKLQKKPGTLSVTTFSSGREVTLMVQDSGPGIPATILPRVFEPFVTSKTAEANAGLGLHCAHKSVREHGGKMHVRSKPGEGTTVKVVLPLPEPVVVVERAPAPVAEEQPAAPAADERSGE